jgi:uncharacterized protein (DUF1919 family)
MMAASAASPLAFDDDQPRGLSARKRLLRLLAGDAPFTIVSNNCWGAHVYQALGLPYATPFVGLFVPPDSYLALLRDFADLMRADLAFVGESRSTRVNAWRAREGLSYPIGLLGGVVEVNFQHYPDEAAALYAWHRRSARMSRDPRRLFFKFDDREGASEADIETFCALELANKVCFTAASHRAPTVVAPAAPGEDNVLDGLSLGAVSRRYFNTLRWISALPRWAPLPSLI